METHSVNCNLFTCEHQQVLTGFLIFLKKFFGINYEGVVNFIYKKLFRGLILGKGMQNDIKNLNELMKIYQTAYKIHFLANDVN